MKTLKSVSWFVFCIALCFLAVVHLPAAAPEQSNAVARQAASKLYNDGNYKDAFDAFKKLAMDPADDRMFVGQDLGMAVNCLNQLNRQTETDALIEDIVKIHAANWRLLQSAAQSYFNGNHYGTMIAGSFERGPHRGGGRYMNSAERDRVRALQLMRAALDKTSGESDKNALASFHLEFARMLVGYRGYGDAWKLQYLTDLSVLPDYEEGYWYGYGGESKGAPVDDSGNPVFHAVPKGFDAAQTDGERWRWMLVQATELGNAWTRNSVWMDLAGFLDQQFGVQTMAIYGGFLRGGDDEDNDKSRPQTYALHTLGDDETIARLATGVKRFKLPDEFNAIKLYSAVAESTDGGRQDQAFQQLAQIFENRRQFAKAAENWRKSCAKANAQWKQERIDQILGNWGSFEPVMTRPAGEAATLQYRFRNGSKVSFEAHEIKVSELLGDVKEYLKSNPRQLEWERMNIGNIGYSILDKNNAKYVGDKVASWEMELKPRPMHFDKRVDVETPLKKAGAYLVTAKMAGGNISKIVVWIDDTAIVKKQLDNKAYFFVADSVTGEPLGKMNVEFFGYRQANARIGKVVGRDYNVVVQDFAEYTDADGQVFLDSKKFSDHYQWLIIARTDGGRGKGRLAYLGFTGIWFGSYYDQEYNQTKVFSMTDRPVYRPMQPVKFKLWVRHAKYDQEDTSSYAKASFEVVIHNPKGEEILKKAVTADEFGGLEGEYMLPADAALGSYNISLTGYGGGTFRVEEYKKPEFEVTVTAPTEPVMLGDKIAAEIKARYYFGAPVAKGRVKYKVLRSDYRANWYPRGCWDWFYGPGYWWFAYDYKWYPGWNDWGCLRPRWWWWPTSYTPPEVVAEVEKEIPADGILKVEIDTAVAKEMHGDTDHRYEITAEVTDESRRTIVGSGAVLVARKPFKVYCWVDRGHYRVGDTVQADVMAQTLDNKPVKGKGEMVLYRVEWKDGKPVEKAVKEWNTGTDDQGRASLQIKASKSGQYRLSCKVTDGAKHEIEGAYVFCVMGEGKDSKDYRFNEIELVPDKKEYAPGENVRLRINTDRKDSVVLLFLRPANGIYTVPKVIRLKGKSTVEEIGITKKDMPNFFVEAMVIGDGKVHSEMREIVVPPESRVINVAVEPSAAEYKPGQQAKVKVKLTDMAGKPFVGSVVMTVYDRAVEYISGGSNVPEIKAFFWKWRRSHHPNTESSIERWFSNLTLPNKPAMQSVGVFGDSIADESGLKVGDDKWRVDKAKEFGDRNNRKLSRRMFAKSGAMAMPACAPMAEQAGAAVDMCYAMDASVENKEENGPGGGEGAGDGAAAVEPTVRKEFADTAFWAGSLLTTTDGLAEVEFKMPENLTGWKVKTWAMGHGTKVGEGSADVVTAKKLLLRLQAPRFFTEKDEVVLSANIHNYLDKAKQVQAVLELDGGCLELMAPDGKTGDAARQTVKIDAGGEQRVDWRVKVVKEGKVIVRMKALTDEESDAMQMEFPVYVHGMLKTDSFSGVVRPQGERAAITIDVPAERRMDESRLEIRYSPTLAGAMADALPYLVEYPYGCTEQTLNRFLPTVITHKILKDMGLNLKEIRDKQTNLNAQEIGNDKQRMEDWKRLAGTQTWDGEKWAPRNPVFDEAVVEDMVKDGVKRLAMMQLSDGGWGWFSGWGECSYPHTTAYVVHGLQIARQNGVAIVPDVMDRGIEWLARYQAEQVRLIKNAPGQVHPWKNSADNLDAFVYMVLVDAGRDNADMREFLYRDRNNLAVYAKSMFGMALNRLGAGQKDKLDMIMSNIGQYLVEDKENQTAWLNLGNEGYWWYWYGSEYEAQAYYLKLLAATDPKSEKAAGLVKYLLNNRRNATYWKSTRDTAICIEAMADYLRASGEDKPDMSIEIYVDGRKMKDVRVTADNLFSFDNKLVLTGDAVETGKHKVEIVRKGRGPVYFNAYLSNFTLEDFITKAGLEIKVNRKYYKLNPVDKKIKAVGAHGQALDRKVEKYERAELANMAMLKSGDLVEVELEIESKNDYEYIIFEDMKAAGFEPVEVRSGYNGNDLGAYMELRDERVCLFVRELARGRHSVAYRLRAEIPGRFSALPTRAHAMYAPELKANSDEIKLSVED